VAGFRVTGVQSLGFNIRRLVTQLVDWLRGDLFVGWFVG
jgi:hypothetical protein